MTRSASLALLLAFALGGCSLIVDTNTPRVTNHCTADLDCATGAHCDATMSMCVQEPTLPYDLWLEVAPPNDATGTVAATDLGPYVTFSGSIPLVVAHQVTARGTVRRDNAPTVPVTAQITFTPMTTSPLGAHAVSTRTTTGGDTDFTISLPSRGMYDVLVEPLGDFRATVPPFRSTFVVGATDTALRIPLPTDEAHVTQIEGDLVDPSGAALVDYEVLALDRASGALISSVATTTNDAAAPGHFIIAIAVTNTPFDLVIRPSAARQARGLVPTYHVRPEGLLPDAHNHVRVLIPATVPAISWEGTVEYPESRGMRPVAGAVVQLHSDDVIDATTGVVGSLDLTLTTDADGVYRGTVLPGNYTVTITPSSDEELGVLREQRDLHPTSGIIGHVFRLPLRTVLTGTVQSPDGDLVRDAHVRATPLGIALMGLTDPNVARLARPATALAGPMGDFRLELDVGVYDLIVEPPDGSGFAWTVVLDYGIGGTTATLADVMQIDAPVVVESDLTWLDGGALSGAEVRAFAITPDGRAVMVGRATSDAHGHARMLVPAMLGSHDPTMALRH